MSVGTVDRTNCFPMTAEIPVQWIFFCQDEIDQIGDRIGGVCKTTMTATKRHLYKKIKTVIVTIYRPNQGPIVWICETCTVYVRGIFALTVIEVYISTVLVLRINGRSSTGYGPGIVVDSNDYNLTQRRIPRLKGTFWSSIVISSLLRIVQLRLIRCVMLSIGPPYSLNFFSYIHSMCWNRKSFLNVILTRWSLLDLVSKDLQRHYIFPNLLDATFMSYKKSTYRIDIHIR